MEEDNLPNAINFLLENNESSSSSHYNNDAISNSSVSTDEDQNQFLENDWFQEDLLFPLLQLLLNGRRREHVQNFLNVVHAKNNVEFREDFRLSRPTVYMLLESLETSGFIPTHEFGKEKKPAELCLLMTLWFLSNKEPHRTLSNLFDISLSSVFRIIRRVINWLITLVPDVITWPKGNHIIRISRGFEEVAGIRNCVGAIDGSHIYK
ncbi:uncharacterized protein LOC112590736 [Harpegnathos saltator]|uniref:uncharacterized protein LOC112590736 n=1 Tax=Harpegnathos saltator TaxID=610380 RepID=UPI000DBED362|nr:uncharacterized protein LOC112590736 [Harpegnathos saltator]XP_025163939.1 uncharacterized protein LOC112590736 [Harpegnathos saltator]